MGIGQQLTSSIMNVEQRTFDELFDQWRQIVDSCAETTFFDQHTWQKVWWSEFGSNSELSLLAVRSDSGDVEMIAPLMVDGNVVSFLGRRDLVDYHDFLSRGPLRYELFESIVKTITETTSAESIALQSIPGDSPSIKHFKKAAERFGWLVEIQQEDVAPRLLLPDSWDDYVFGLRKKDRHELRRKLRRLGHATDFKHTELTRTEDIEAGMDDFMSLYGMGTGEKKDFMTPEREQFFRKVSIAMSSEESTRLCFLELDGERVAGSLSFVCRGVRFLYNSCYDPAYSNLSVGLLNHALSIKASITQKHRIFDFMRGDEAYKYRLGGSDREIYALTATRLT